MIKTNKEMSVNTLAHCFGVSAMTIRRDLDQLEQSKLISNGCMEKLENCRRKQD